MYVYKILHQLYVHETIKASVVPARGDDYLNTSFSGNLS